MLRYFTVRKEEVKVFTDVMEAWHTEMSSIKLQMTRCWRESAAVWQGVWWKGDAKPTYAPPPGAVF